jgi:hypothetical protein
MNKEIKKDLQGSIINGTNSTKSVMTISATPTQESKKKKEGKKQRLKVNHGSFFNVQENKET